MLPNFRRSALILLGLVVMPLAITSAMAQNTTPGRANILFTQQDEVQQFVIGPGPDGTLVGSGFQTGTAIGKISGTSFVSWTFKTTSPIEDDVATISFNNTVIITDLDGDQITFKHVGTGLFHFAFVEEAFRGTGGTLTGTYEVTGGIGKYESWIGNKYDYRGVATNPPADLAAAFGTVYAEIYSNKSKN